MIMEKNKLKKKDHGISAWIWIEVIKLIPVLFLVGSGKCLTSDCPKEKEKNKPWFVVFSGFHWINTPWSVSSYQPDVTELQC